MPFFFLLAGSDWPGGRGGTPPRALSFKSIYRAPLKKIPGPFQEKKILSEKRGSAGPSLNGALSRISYLSPHTGLFAKKNLSQL